MLDSTHAQRRWRRFARGGSPRDLVVTLAPLLIAIALGTWALFHFVRPGAPRTLTISTGPDGSTFQRAAERYAKEFAKAGVTLRVRPSNGSLENLRRVSDPRSDVDVGFVQVGVKLPDPAPGERRRPLVSLGTIARQPLYVLVRTPAPDRLSALAGKRLVVGPEGSGTRFLALKLLDANGIKPDGETRLLELDDEKVGDALAKGEVDAAFLMGDSASPRVIRAIIQRPGISVLELSQLDAYLRRFQDLGRIVIPMGSFDFGKNLPAQDLNLVGASIELVARGDLHPAISDLLLETMREVHGRPTLLAKAGEFPVALEHELPISADARRYYQSGKRWLYRMLPFWAASLADRFLMVLLPLVLLLVPVFRLMPAIYRWRIRTRVVRIYGALLELEREAVASAPPERAALLERVDAIERRAEGLKLPAAYADQFYVLREHIALVRRRLTAAPPGEQRRA